MLLVLALGLWLPSDEAEATQEVRSWRIYTRAAGLHRVAYEDLLADAPSLAALSTHALSLENQGRLVKLFVSDGGDGEFGPGDWFEFIAEVLSGQETYYHPYARHNVYLLTLAQDKARRLAPVPAPNQSALAGAEPFQALRRRHFEEDRLLIRLPDTEVADEVEPELWYWAKLTHLSKEPFALDLDLTDANLESMVELAVGLRGLSELPGPPAARRLRDHLATISVEGVPFTRTSWDGRQPVVSSRTAAWPAGQRGKAHRLEVSVDQREREDDPLVDVVMVDWVEVGYAHNGLVVDDQMQLEVPPEVHGGVLELRSQQAERLVVVGRRTGYMEIEVVAGGTARIPLAPLERSVWVRRLGKALSPVAIENDRPSDLRSFANQADYLIVAHGSLIDAAADLVSLHSERGLEVALIDVQDVYDEFGHGIVSPTAIKSFLTHAYHNWATPRPRFVLLLGDASWDTKNATVDDANYSNWVGRQLLWGDRFVAKKSDSYDAARRNDRNLVPSWNYHTQEGHAAADVFYAMLEGDDELPDIALGRFPVTRPAEVRAITAKIRRYIEEAPLGPWRSRLTWISGGNKQHKRRSVNLALAFVEQGLGSLTVLPGPKASMEDRNRIHDAFAEGHLVTHFIGHGGRFIWRTGPPDLKNQVDLFGLEDLEELPPTSTLPVVLSVSCYSAPFDHPSADSIGEAFLRLPDSGAVAFIGASWRNAPPQAFSSTLVTELSRPGTIGEALMRAKRQVSQRDVTHLFNLLGDPATPVAAPQQRIELEYSLTGDTLELAVELPAIAVGGRASFDFYDAEGRRIDQVEVASIERQLSLRHASDPRIHTVTAYFWNDETRIDGIASARILQPSPPPVAGAAGR